MNLAKVRRADGTVPNQTVRDDDFDVIRRKVKECPYRHRTTARARFIQRLAMDHRVCADRIREIARGRGR